MKKLLPLFLALPVGPWAWLQAQPSRSATSALCRDYTFCSSSEWKFWGIAAGILMVLVIVSYVLRNQVKAWISRQEVRHTLIVAGLFVVAVLGSHIVGREGCKDSCDWAKTLDPNLEESDSPQDQFTIAAKFSNATQQRLREQYREIRGRARHHLKVMAYFFSNYYRAIQMMALLGAIAAVALFFVAFKGWASTNQYVRNVFITATVLTGYFSLYPTVFKQQDNITDNKNLYLQYVALQNSVRTFAATGESSLGTEHTVKDESEFLNDIDQRMAALNNIAIGFDYTKVSYTGIFSTTQKGQPPDKARDSTKPK